MSTNSSSQDESGSDASPETTGLDIHPFLETTGLTIDLWPAWAAFPSQGVFIPYFSAHISDDDKSRSLVTTMSLSDLVFTCAQIAHVLKLSSQAANGLGTAKVALFTTKKDLLDELDGITSNIGALRALLTETDRIKEIDANEGEDDAE